MEFTFTKRPHSSEKSRFLNKQLIFFFNKFEVRQKNKKIPKDYHCNILLFLMLTINTKTIALGCNIKNMF